MDRFDFGPARPSEQIVFGAQRPGYSGKSVQQEQIDEWVAFMQHKGVKRVCCLLPQQQLEYYDGDLLATYCRAFGSENVCHVAVMDYHLSNSGDLFNRILPFLSESDDRQMRVVVHCSGGSGRTGHVLAAWLVRRWGLAADEAINLVRQTGRNPREAVQFGNATELELLTLLEGVRTAL
jgi:protein-tyrosine phosphatase